jgi:hypothetical protein
MPQPGRPRVLTDFKQREVIVLIFAGCSARRAARYVGCSQSTIMREADRNSVFREQLKDAELQARLDPLRAIQQASATHSAWWLDRTQPEFVDRSPNYLSRNRVRSLLQNLLDVVDKESLAPSTHERLRWHILAAINDTSRKTQDSRQGRRELREAIEHYATKERPVNPFTEIRDFQTELEHEFGRRSQFQRQAVAPEPSGAKQPAINHANRGHIAPCRASKSLISRQDRPRRGPKQVGFEPPRGSPPNARRILSLLVLRSLPLTHFCLKNLPSALSSSPPTACCAAP